MAKKSFVKIKCEDCKRINYHTNRPKSDKEGKLEFKKFCKFCKKHTAHKESKK